MSRKSNQGRVKAARAASAIRARADRNTAQVRALYIRVIALEALVRTMNEDNQRLIVHLGMTIPERSEETP